MSYGLLSAIANAAKNFAVDDLGATGIFSRIKIAFGVEGAAVDISATNPLPVTDAGLTTLGTKLDTLHTDLSGAPSPIPTGGNVIGKFGIQANGADVTTAAPLPVVNPSGPTATAQTTGNNSLASMDSKLPALLNGALPTTSVAPAVLYAPISQAVTASTAVVAATAGKSIKVLGYFVIMSGGANTVTFLNGSTAVTGPLGFAGNGGVEASPSNIGHFVTSVGAALNMTLSAATLVGGHIVYQLV